MNEKKLLTAIKLFKKRQNSDKFRVNMQERNERILYYQSKSTILSDRRIKWYINHKYKKNFSQQN